MKKLFFLKILGLFLSPFFLFLGCSTSQNEDESIYYHSVIDVDMNDIANHTITQKQELLEALHRVEKNSVMRNKKLTLKRGVNEKTLALSPDLFTAIIRNMDIYNEKVAKGEYLLLGGAVYKAEEINEHNYFSVMKTRSEGGNNDDYDDGADGADWSWTTERDFWGVSTTVHLSTTQGAMQFYEIYNRNASTNISTSVAVAGVILTKSTGAGLANTLNGLITHLVNSHHGDLIFQAAMRGGITVESYKSNFPIESETIRVTWVKDSTGALVTTF